MRIAVVGAGGVGGYFGGRLALGDHEVHFVARGRHLAAIQEHGLRVESIAGDFVVSCARATSEPATIGVVDAVIFAVKTWQLREAAAAARPLVGEETALLPLLNGVEAAEMLSGMFGEERVLGGLCRISAEIVAPGQVRHAGIEPTVVFGELDDRASPRVERLRTAFTDAGVSVEIPPRIASAVWAKFMLIATWSGVGAITRAPIGVWRALPETRSMAEACLREIQAVARAKGIAVPERQVEATLRFFDEVPPETTASMQRDIVDGRPSELESQNGAVVRMGAAAGVATPTHAFIYHGLLPQERAARAARDGAPARGTPAQAPTDEPRP